MKKKAPRKSYETDIVLGEKYRDEQTGYEGVATSIHFYQHACERVAIESYDERQKQVREIVFDAPRLTHIATGKVAKVTKTGGPARAGETRPSFIR
jgi:hypothetical protein